MFVKLAVLNLWRRKSRTVIVVMMIALSLAGLMFLQGLYDGWLAEIIKHTINSDGGELVVQHKEYRLSRRLAHRVIDVERLVGRLAGQPGVKRAAPRIITDAMAATGRSSQGAQLIGVLPVEFAQGALGRYIVKGRPFEPARMPEAVIAADFAEKMKVGIGKKLILTTQGLDNNIVSLAVRVVGIVRTYNMYLDKNSVFIDYREASRILGLADGATRITVVLDDPATLPAMVARLLELPELLGPEFEVLSWRQRYKALDYSVEAMTIFNLIHYGIVFIVVALGITDIIIISVLERVREFGIMLALGTKFKTIKRIILLESLILGGSGLVIGVGLGLAILAYYRVVGLDLSAFSEGLKVYAMPSVLHTDIRAEYLLYAMVSVTVASLVSALAPIRMLKKRNPIQSITMT